MGRHADKQRTRVAQMLARALGRGDAEPAVAALLELAPAERTAHLAPVAALLRAAVAADFRARRWDRLAFWAARVEREGRLLDGDDGELRWALFWGRARIGAWPKAAALLSGLSARLPAGLAAALQAYVAAAGAPPPEVLAGWSPPAPPAPAPLDLRLGYDRGQAAAEAIHEPEGPTSLEQVEERVLAAWGGLAGPRFAALTDVWAAGAPTLAGQVRLLAAELSVHTLLTCAQNGDDRWLEAAGRIAAACQDLRHPEALQDAMALALRVAVGAADGTVARGLMTCRLVGAALGYDALEDLAVAAFCDLPRPRPRDDGSLTSDEERLGRAALALGERLLERRADPAVFWRALLVWGMANHVHAPPAWLKRAASAVVEAGADLAGALACLPSDERDLAIDAFVHTLPLPIVERGLAAMWGPGGDALRPLLAHATGRLIDCLRPKEMSPAQLAEGARLLQEETGLPVSPAHVRALLEEIGGPLPDFLGEPTGPLSGRALAVWRRFGERLLPYDIRFLEYALEVARDRPAAEAALDRYLAQRDDATAMLDELCAADATACHRASAAIEGRLLTRYAGDADALARALIKAIRMGAPRELRTRLAAAVVSAAATATEHSAEVTVALRVARLLVRQPRRRRKATPKARKPRAPRAAKRQLDLFGAGDPEPGGEGT